MLILILSFPAFAQQAHKESKKLTDTYNAEPVQLSKSDLSALKHTKSGRIDKIIDSLTILLKDGTIVRLSGIDIPDFQMWDYSPLADDTLALLNQKLPERTEVMLYQTRNSKFGHINRMGHELGQLVIKDNSEWVQGDLIANGLARVYTSPKLDDLLAEMYALETIAREQQRGLWKKDSPHALLTTEDLSNRKGSFVVVEGTVEKAASVRNTLYLNFGKDWKTDFTVMITPTLRKEFSKKGINILGLSGVPVRARGWLREYNGPLIELEDAAHLEVLQPPQPVNGKIPLQNDTESLNLPEDSIDTKKVKATRMRGNNNYGSAQ